MNWLLLFFIAKVCACVLMPVHGYVSWCLQLKCANVHLTYVGIWYVMQTADPSSHIPGSLWGVAALEPQIWRIKGVLFIPRMKLMVRAWWFLISYLITFTLLKVNTHMWTFQKLHSLADVGHKLFILLRWHFLCYSVIGYFLWAIFHLLRFCVSFLPVFPAHLITLYNFLFFLLVLLSACSF